MGVRRHFTQRGQLATERALIDDNGDGVGRETGGEGTDGSLASRLYLDPDVPGAAPTDEELLLLLQKRAALQIDADELKQRRQLMTPDEYQKEFERIMLALATVSRDIRRKQKTYGARRCGGAGGSGMRFPEGLRQARVNCDGRCCSQPYASAS